MERKELLCSLAKEALLGKQEAFEKIYTLTNDNVYFHAKKILRNEEDCLDAVQDTYLAAYKNFSSLKDPEHVQQWLCGIAGNICYNKIRKNKHEVDFATGENGDFGYEIADESATPEESAERNATVEIVSKMVDELPEAQKLTVIMFYYDEMSIAQIAEAMGCSENTVKSRLSYSRKKLEADVRAEEKRSGVRLYSVSPAIILLALRFLASGTKLDAATAAAIGANVAAKCSAAATTAAVSGTGGAAAGVTSGTAIKIAAIALPCLE